MINPKLTPITVDNAVYGTMWWDFGRYLKLDVYKDDVRIGTRKLPIDVNREDNTVVYLIRRMVGDYRESTRRTIGEKKV